MNALKVETKEQLEDVYALRSEVFVGEQNISTDEEFDQYEEDATHFVVYDEHQQAVGAGRLRFVDGYGKIERICTAHSARNKGVGRILMNKIEEFVRSSGFTKTTLNAQCQAEPFYLKLGYETLPGEFLDAGIPHVKMVKTL